MDDSTEESPPVKTPIEQLQELNQQLDAIRLSIKDPMAQGFLFTAQGQISIYLETVLHRNLTYYDKKSS